MSLRNTFSNLWSARPAWGTPKTPSNYSVELRNVVKTYETPAGSFTALKNIDLQVEPGEFVAIIGKSGSGKSTMINMVTGIDRPSLGEVYIDGTPIHKMSQRQVSRWRGHRVGVVFQFFQLLPTLTMVENVMLPMEFCQLYTPAERYERAMQLMDMVGIADQAHKFPTALSGGQQQRVAIARSLANDPTLLVADEPTGNLDSKTADAIFQIFSDFVAQGKTILMVTHDRELASAVNRVVVLSDGQIVEQYKPKTAETLDIRQVLELTSNLKPITFPAGSTIYNQGDKADKFYSIIKGSAEISIEHVSGARMVTNQLGKGQYFGQAGMMKGGVRNATVAVSSDQDLIAMAIDRPTYHRLTDEFELNGRAISNMMRQKATSDILREIFAARMSDQISFPFTKVKVPAGDIILQQGDPADSFYIIDEGNVEIMSPYDDTEVRAVLVAGQYFGELGLLQGQRRSNTVRAKRDGEGVTLIAIDQDVFHQMLVQDSLIQDEIEQTMKERLEISSSRLMV